MDTKIYLGDSVYCEFDGHSFVLTTENGFGPSNTIVLEPEVLLTLKQFSNKITTQLASRAEAFHLVRRGLRESEYKGDLKNFQDFCEWLNSEITDGEEGPNIPYPDPRPSGTAVADPQPMRKGTDEEEG